MEILKIDFFLQRFIAIIFSLLILANARLSQKIFKSNLHPSVIFSFFWFIFTIIPLLFVWNIPINPWAILFILGISMVITISGLPLTSFSPSVPADLSVFKSDIMKFIYIFCSFSSFVLSVQIVLKNGFNLSDFIINFFTTTSNIAKNRTMESIEYGIIGILAVFFTYFSAIIGAIVAFFVDRKRKKYLWYFVATLPALFVMLTQSSKIVFLISSILILSTTFLLKVLTNQQILVTRKNFFAAIGLLILFFPVLLISFMSREGYNNFFNISDAYSRLAPTITSYFFGSVYAFSDFFSAFTGNNSLSSYQIERGMDGYYSFKPLFELFGGRKVFPPGYYPDNFSYNGVETNLYTAFRGFLQDFGISGTLIFFYFFGLVFNFSFVLIKSSNRPIISGSLYIMFLAFTGLSFMINIFTARYIFLICGSFTVLQFLGYLRLKR